MTNIRILRENSGVAKRRLRKYSIDGRYQKMVESEPDKTNFNRPPYYMTTKKKKVSRGNWKRNLMEKFERVY